MKKRTKEEMAAYQKARRHAMTPKKCNTPDVTPVSVPCPDCAALSLEVKALLAKVALLQAQVREKEHDDASLYQRGVAEKVGRISTHSTGHTIGSVR
jgi:hypothetical protein